MAGNLISRRSRLTTVLLTLLALFLLGTVAVLSTAKAYFSIDKSAYILPEELGTWEEIRWGANSDSPIGWANKYPWVWKILHPQTVPATNSAEAAAALSSTIAVSKMGKDEAEAATLAAAVAAGQIPPLRDNSPKPPDPNSPPEKIPRIIHQTWKDDVLPPKWQAVRDECQAIHPDYEYMLWTDASSRSFIAENYPWFLSVFDSYPHAIQRADAIRYFVLHKYGGIYMDLDIGCTRRMDPLLRFEVILPETRPVGVSNDLIFAAKGHSFMDQTIHNLITFNHIYLTHYPTVMFSTGPMFLSASYGIYVDAHGAAYPSGPTKPEVGFKGVRILPKPLYGKNALPAEVPDAFFKHYYGSSWHAGDAGFLIFLRDHGRFLMFLGACLVVYGLFRTVLPRLTFTMRKSTSSNPYTSSGRRRSRCRISRNGGGGSIGGNRAADDSGQWVSLPIQTAPRQRRQGISRSYSHTPDLTLHTPDEEEVEQAEMTVLGLSAKPRLASSSSSGAAMGLPMASSARSVAAPRPQRLSVPSFFDMDDESGEEEDFESQLDQEPSGILAWTGLGSNGPEASSSRDLRSTTPTEYVTTVATRWGERAANGVLLLPAYALSRIGSPGFNLRRSSSTKGEGESSSLTSSSALHSPSGSWSSSGSNSTSGQRYGGQPGSSGSSNLLGWATQMLPAGWRGPNSRGKTPIGDIEGGEDVDDVGKETPLAGAEPFSQGAGADSRRESGVPSWATNPRGSTALFSEGGSNASVSATSGEGEAGFHSSTQEAVLPTSALSTRSSDGYPAVDTAATAAAAAATIANHRSESSTGYFRTPPPPYERS